MAVYPTRVGDQEYHKKERLENRYNPPGDFANAGGE
jgi:hypothetical protein